MNKGIVAVLIFIIAVGLAALYALERGAVLLLKPPAEERIAFISDRNGHSDIWTMRTDGTDALPVTNDEAMDRLPVWSPDGREILAVSDRLGGNYQVFVAAWDGRYVNGLTASTGTKDSPVWSSGGKDVTYISSGKVYIKKRHGGQEQQYLPPSSVPGTGMIRWMNAPIVFADWAPGQNALLFVQETDLGRQAFLVEKDKSGMLADQDLKPLGITVARELDAAWSGHGTRLAVGFMNRKGEHGLQVVDFETMAVEDHFLGTDDNRGVARPSWSPDGESVAFEMWRVKDGMPDECLGVYVIRIGESEPSLVLEGDARGPVWSPDGKQIACAVVRDDGKRDIWRVNADGTGAVNLTNGEGDNHSPSWSPLRK